MTEIYSSNLSDYGYDPVKGLCAQPAAKKAKPADAKPAEKNYCQPDNLLPLPKPSFWAELVQGFRNNGSDSIQIGIGCSTTPVESQVCLADSSPRYPDAGVQPQPTGSVDPITLTINPDDIYPGGKGVDLVWKFKVANCDGNSQNMKVRVHFSDDPSDYAEYTPDANGVVTVSKHFGAGAYPTTNPLLADLYYSNPNSKAAPRPLPGAISLYLPEKAKISTVYDVCTEYPAPQQPIILSSTGDSVDFGQSARFSISPEACDLNPAIDQSDFAVDFYIETGWLVNKLNNAAAIKFANGVYYVDHIFTTSGQQYVKAKVTDLKRGSSVESANYPIYVSPSAASVDIYASSNDGFIASRPVTLNAGWNSTVPGKVNFAWEVTDKTSNKSVLTPASGREVTFTPPAAGTYSVTLTITGEGLTKPIVKTSLVMVYPFSKPSVMISGEQYPASGTPVNYIAVLMPQGRELSAEDAGAVCTWTLSHIDPTSSATIVGVSKQAKSCATPLSFTYPVVSKQTNYLLQVSVTGANQSYTVPAVSIPVSIYPLSAGQASADLAVSYGPDGAIPFRPVTLDGTLIGAPAGVSLTYQWTIMDSDGAPLASQPASGRTSAYSFSKEGLYRAKLEVFGDDLTQPLASKEDSFIIYPFAAPEARIVVNGNQPVYKGQTVPLTALLDRNFQEDASAVYAWKISHREINRDTGKTDAVVDLNPATPAAQVRDLSFTFSQAQSYQVELTVTGMNGATAAYTLKKSSLIDVYLPAGSLTVPGITAPTVGKQEEDVPFAVANPEAGLSYTWNFGDKSAPKTGASVTHKYAGTGSYPVTVTAASNDDPTQIVTSQPWTITIVDAVQSSPIPNLVLTPGMGQAPLAVTANAANSYVTTDGATITDYQFNWGDGSTVENGPQASRAHTYACSNSSCSYTVQLTITDSNGKKATITSAIATWQ